MSHTPIPLLSIICVRIMILEGVVTVSESGLNCGYAVNVIIYILDVQFFFSLISSLKSYGDCSDFELERVPSVSSTYYHSGLNTSHF